MKVVIITQYGFNGPWRRISHDIQAWATCLIGDHLYSGGFFIVSRALNYDFIFIELTDNNLDLALKIKRRAKKQKVIGLLEGSPHYLNQLFPPEKQVKFYEVCQNLDAIGTLNPEMNHYFSLFTDKPVFFTGVPFPLSFAQPHLIPPEKKEKIIELASALFNTRAGLSNLMTFKKMKGARGVGSIKSEKEKDLIKKLGVDIEFRKEDMGDWQGFYKNLCRSYLGLHLDYRWTWGRFSTECAAAGIPCVSTPHSYAQKMLFPKLCVGPWDSQLAIDLLNELLNNPKFYMETRAYALNKVAELDFEPSRQRMLNKFQELKWI